MTIIDSSDFKVSPQKVTPSKSSERSQSPRSTLASRSTRQRRRYSPSHISNPLHVLQELLFPGGTSAAYCNEETASTSFLILDGFMTIFLGDLSKEIDSKKISSNALKDATERWGKRLETNICVGKVSYEYRHSDEAEMYMDMPSSNSGEISERSAPIVSQNLDRVPLVLDHEANNRDILDPKFYFPPSHKMVADALKFQEYNQVAEVYETILDDDLNRYGENDLVCAIDYHNLGVANLLANEHDFALAYFLEAVSRKRQSLGRSDPNVADSLIEIGIILYYRNDHQGSVRYFEEALEIYSDAENSEGVGRASNCIGCVYYQIGHIESAMSYLQEAVVFQKTALGLSETAESSLLNVALTQSNIGFLKFKCGHSDAIAMLEDSLLVLESVLGDDNSTVTSVRSNIAFAKSLAA